jgi:hypothetical protein
MPRDNKERKGASLTMVAWIVPREYVVVVYKNEQGVYKKDIGDRDRLPPKKKHYVFIFSRWLAFA